MTEYKVAVVGAGAVGKSAFTVRFVNDKFIEKYDPTIEDRYRKQIELDFPGQKPCSCMLEVYDTAGQEEYKTLRDAHMNQAEGFLLLYSIDDPKSIKVAQDLILTIRRMKEGETSCIVLVGNKKDLEASRKVTIEEAKSLSDRFEIPWLEASAKNGDGVHEAFIKVTKLVHQVKKKPDIEEKKKKLGCLII